MKRRGIVSLALAGALASAMSIAMSAPAGASGPTYGLHTRAYADCLQPVMPLNARRCDAAEHAGCTHLPGRSGGRREHGPGRRGSGRARSS